MGNAFPYLAVEGSPHDRGVQYGEQATQRIEGSMDLYLHAFAQKGHDREKVALLGARYLESIEGFVPSIVEEMRGIAHGAGVDVGLIAAVNARTEILRASDDGCTAVACLPEVTANGHTIVAQNWDWQSECLDTTVVLHVRPDDGPEFITMVEAGIVGRSGLNGQGVAVAGNYLQSSEDFGHSGVPITTIRRQILGSPSFAEALGCVINTPRAFSSNHLLGSSGMALDLEVTPSNVYTLEDEDGILTHSNHFRSPAALARIEDLSIRRLPDSLYREKRLRSLLTHAKGKIDRDTIVGALRDHQGYPRSICRHPAPRSDGSISQTVASIIMDIEDGLVSVAAGPPCEAEYETYKLDSVNLHGI